MDKRKRILICDDEEGVRESLKLILEEAYALDFVSNGDDAVKKVVSDDYDGLLLDIKMPVKDGLDTLAEVRSISTSIKVIVVTGYQSIETASKAVKLGAMDYITKPFESSEVKEKAARI